MEVDANRKRIGLSMRYPMNLVRTTVPLAEVKPLATTVGLSVSAHQDKSQATVRWAVHLQQPLPKPRNNALADNTD
ncbi:hypothetical protein JCM19235_7095 [Vibrio maritimus]|uniref:Uncharacterized protein n=1 Tax=Vibrio maritimus TaxID=990268 RepID=A0A090S625_9VIBR|nr:hypothetical protein JCM19235_7095 [Vibrio maritimus]